MASEWKIQTMAQNLRETTVRLLRGESVEDLRALQACDLSKICSEAIARAIMIAEREAAFDKEGPKVPKTVGDWQLYSSHHDSPQAARELCAAAKEAGGLLRKQIKSQGCQGCDLRSAAKLVGEGYSQTVSPVMRKWKTAGADDSEPGLVATQYLIGVAKHALGIPMSQHTPELGDYI